MPQTLSSFFYRVVVPANDLGVTAIITQALESKDDIKDNVPVILDIDVIKSNSDGFLEDDILSILEKLRKFKNQIFFKSITDKLLEEYR